MKREEFDRRVGRNLLKRRKALGLSQEEVGDYIEVTFQQIQKYERGINSLRLYRAMMLANLFSCSIDDLCSGT